MGIEIDRSSVTILTIPASGGVTKTWDIETLGFVLNQGLLLPCGGWLW